MNADLHVAIPDLEAKKKAIVDLFWSKAAYLTRIEPSVRPSRPDVHWFFKVLKTALDKPVLSQYMQKRIDRSISGFVAAVNRELRGEVATFRVWIKTQPVDKTQPESTLNYVINLVASLSPSSPC